ncbi:hypothetical protein NVP1003O_22 [Vibrio phage 1.003.O._10N.286.48.A2]|nr:hypothetical protein NVP1003O_22 [Vibrio phage 1.003.O._10N.286.48.A2]
MAVFNDVKSMKEYYIFFNGSYHICSKGEFVFKNLTKHTAHEKCKELNDNHENNKLQSEG